MKNILRKTVMLCINIFMGVINNFKNAVLAMPLVITQAIAEEASDKHQADLELNATDHILTSIAPIRDEFLQIAGTNVFILSADRLLPPDKLRDTQIFMDMGVSPSLTFTDQEIIDILDKATEGLITPFRDSIDKYRDLGSLEEHEREFVVKAMRVTFDTIIKGRALAAPGNPEQCMIIAPRSDISAQEAVGQLAYMPKHYKPKVNPNISANLIFNHTMGHEAAHCNQERHFEDGVIGLRLQSVAGERDADNAAYEALEDAPYIQEAKAALLASRQIGNLRLAADFFNDSNEIPLFNDYSIEIPAHIIFPEDTDQNAFDYNEADVVLAAKAIQTATNMAAGFTYGQIALQSNNPAFDGLEINFVDDFIEQFAEVGRTINYEYPEIEYATLKVLGGFFFEHYQEEQAVIDKVEHPVARNMALIGKQMVDDYITAMETYYPEVVQSSLAQNQMAKLRTLIEQSQTSPSDDNNDIARRREIDLPKDSREALSFILSFIKHPELHRDAIQEPNPSITKPRLLP